MADVAHEHQAAARQCERLSVDAGVFAIRVQATRHRFAALGERCIERALHQAEPIAIDTHLVFGIDRGHGVLAVLDRRDRRFQHDVSDVRGGFAPDRVLRTRVDLYVQAVVHKQVADGVAVP